jgi:hypothetical protein
MNTLRTALLTAGLHLLTSALAGDRTVVLSAKLELLDGGTARTRVVVQDAHGATDTVLTGAAGTLRLVLQEDARVLLTFLQEGYVTKVVEVNTANAFSRFSDERQRKVAFTVELIPQNADKSLAYAAPVGHITFAKGGLMKAAYDRQLVTLAVAETMAAAR